MIVRFKSFLKLLDKCFNFWWERSSQLPWLTVFSVHFYSTCPLHLSVKQKYLFLCCSATANSSCSFWPRWTVCQYCAGKMVSEYMHFGCTSYWRVLRFQDSELWSMDEIADVIRREGESIAVVLLPGVHYFTGQVFDMKRITKVAHEHGCMVSCWHEKDHEGCSRTRLHGKLVTWKGSRRLLTNTVAW